MVFFFTLLKTYQVSKQVWDLHSGYFGYFFVTFCICLLLVISSLNRCLWLLFQEVALLATFSKKGYFGYFFKEVATLATFSKKWLFWLPFQRSGGSGYFGYSFKEVAILATFSKKWLFWLFLVISDNFWLLLPSQNWLFRLIFRSKVL